MHRKLLQLIEVYKNLKKRPFNMIKANTAFVTLKSMKDVKDLLNFKEKNLFNKLFMNLKFKLNI
jgi:hypothetical protein